MATEDKVIRIPAYASPDADVFLGGTRIRESESEKGCADEGNSSGHTDVIG